MTIIHCIVCTDCQKDFDYDHETELSKHIDHSVLEYTVDIETEARFYN